jgi:hypothetical protein
MRTIRIKLYKFNELSESAKQKAIESLSDINVDFEWWESIYEDAKNIGLEITGFDSAYYCTGQFINDAEDTAELILKEHGESCETYKDAEEFMRKFIPTKEKYESENEGWYFRDTDESEEMAQDFLNDLLEDYRIMLRNEYEYQTSEEAIIETIEANEYEFTQDGKLN